MIKLNNIKKSYYVNNEEINVLKNINLDLGNSGCVFIIGESGCGKTTLLNIIGLLDNYNEGNYYYNNKDVKKFNNHDINDIINNDISFIFQDCGLIEELSVIDNLKICINRNELDTILKKFNLYDIKEKKINTLSGGQKQRVAIARALAKKPKIILADEPTGNLDSQNSTNIMNYLKEISENTLVIIACHNLDLVSLYSDEVFILKDGEIQKHIIKSKCQNNNIIINKKNHHKFSSLKLSLNLCVNKKMKLLIQSIIISIIMVMLTILYSISNHNYNYYLKKILENNNYNIIEYKKQNDSKEIFVDIDDVNELSNNVYPIYKLNEHNKIENFLCINDSNNLSDVKILVSNNNNINVNIIGKYPKENNEIAISNYIANKIIKKGIYNSENILVYPKDYNQIIGMELKYENNLIKITGIIDYKKNNLYKNTIYNIIFANDKFIKNLKLKELSYLNKNNYYSINNIRIENDIKLLDESITYFENDEKSISKLQYNQIIIPSTFFENNNLNNKFTLEIFLNNPYLIKKEGVTPNYKIENMEIIGTSNDNSFYVSNEQFKQFVTPRIYIDSVSIITNNYNSIEKIKNDKYTIVTSFSNDLDSFYNKINSIKPIIIIFMIILLIFYYIVSFTMVYNSIIKNLRNIRILKSLGIPNLSIYNLFFNENIIVILLSIPLSIIINNILINFLNSLSFISTNLDISIFNIDYISLISIYILSTIMFIMNVYIILRKKLNKKIISIF